MISISHVYIDRKIKKAVEKVLTSGLLVQGRLVKKLENKIAQLCGTKYAVVVNSGTAALHTALVSLGIKQGDEVITTPFSFIATVNSILMCGAKPIFVDVDETFNINPKLVESKISQKTKAILTVDLYGRACNYQAISRIARKFKIRVISDCAQSFGAKYKNKSISKWVDVTCFSFYATKNVMMGEGGALVTDYNNVYNFAKRFRHHGQDMNKPYSYRHLGYNYRSTDLLAAIGLAQMNFLVRWTKKRYKNAKKLSAKLQNIPGLILPDLPERGEHVMHQYTVRITEEFPITRDTLGAYLHKKGVNTGIYYPSILAQHPHIKSIASYKRGMYPNAEKFSREVLSLPIQPNLKNADFKKIVGLIRKVANEKA